MTAKYKHVFILYCRDNLAEVIQLHEDLIKAGENVWWDHDIKPGQDRKFAIRQAMKQSYAVVLCLSEESQRRTVSGIYPEALDAIAAYREYSPGSVFLIPVRLSDCEIPPIEIDGTRTLERLQYVDLFPVSSRGDGIRSLIEAIRLSPHRLSSNGLLNPDAHSVSTNDMSSLPQGRLSRVSVIPSTGSVDEDILHLKDPEGKMMEIPGELDRFVGREHELDELRRALFVSPHLVTLTGIGGVGKSRLAIRFTYQSKYQYGGGIWLINLADVLDPIQISQKIAEVLGLHEHNEDRRSLISVIQSHFKSKEKDILLVVDNCEHLLPDCAEIIKQLIQHCPNLYCLSTSQEPLGIRGEKLLPIKPFELLDPTQLPSVTDVIHNEAIELFLKRIHKEIDLTEQTVKALAQICWYVDGIPLAIELVAARLEDFGSIVELAEELITKLEDKPDEYFKLLENTSINDRRYHNKMWLTLDWSYQRLQALEQKFLDRLSVFMGGCSLEAASKVCADDTLDTSDIRNLLKQLKLKSLIEYENQESTLRYRLLQSIRIFGLKHLREGGEYMDIKQRHAQHYMELAENGETELKTVRQQEWLTRLEDERDNFRAAIKYCHEKSLKGNEELTLIGLRLVGALSLFWLVRGYWQEGRASIESMLASSGGSGNSFRAKAMYGAGRLAWAQVDYEAAKELMEESYELYKSAGDKSGMAWALHELGNIARYRFDHDEVMKFYQEALSLFEEVGNKHGIAWTLHDMGRVSRDIGGVENVEAARSNFRQSLKIFQELEDSRAIAHSYHNFAHLERLQEHYEEARDLYHECLKSFNVIGDKNGIAWAYHHLGNIERYTKNYPKAIQQYESSLRVFQQIENRAGIAWTKRNMGKVILKQNNDERAAELCQGSFTLFRNIKDTRGIAAAYSDLGDIAVRHNNSSEAAKHYKRSLRRFQKLKDKKSIADVTRKLDSVTKK